MNFLHLAFIVSLSTYATGNVDANLCVDSVLKFRETKDGQDQTCTDTELTCAESPTVRSHCKAECDNYYCCEDSEMAYLEVQPPKGKPIVWKPCTRLKKYCSNPDVASACPVTCKKCVPHSISDIVQMIDLNAASNKDAFEEQEVIISEQGATISEQGATISEQGATISEQGVTISEQGVTISEQGATISEQGATISEQGAINLEQGTTISEQGATISEQGATISEQGATISEQGATISEQGVMNLEQWATISDFGDIIVNQGAIIGERETTITDLKEGVRDLESRYRFGNYEYAFASELKPWADHNRTAHEWGGHLASCHSNEESIFMMSLVRNSALWGMPWVFIDGVRSGDTIGDTIYNTDGTAFDYLNWYDNEPHGQPYMYMRSYKVPGKHDQDGMGIADFPDVNLPAIYKREFKYL